jgi:hypothetical protein
MFGHATPFALKITPAECVAHIFHKSEDLHAAVAAILLIPVPARFLPTETAGKPFQILGMG